MNTEAAKTAAWMSPEFLAAWAKTGREEGGYVDHPADSGGATNWGITEEVARAHGYEGDMRDLTRAQAREIAKDQYWDILRLDDVAEISVLIAEELFDSGLNVGQGTVGRWLQRLINVGTQGRTLRVDGLIGRMTVAGLSAFLKRRGKDGETVILRALNGLQSAHYTGLAEAREKDEAFWFGWQLNRVRIL